MPPVFNAYREWLDVESASETPNYYELLGLPPLEADTARINTGYQRQAGRLAPHLSGSQAEQAQRLMGELAEARMTLLTPTAKRAYDQAITARSQEPSLAPSVHQPAPAAPVAETPPAAGPEPAAAPTAYGGSQPGSYPTAAQPAAAPQPYAGQGYAAPQGYAGSPGYGAPQGYPAATGYAVPQNYPAAPGYPPAQGHPGWQPQPAAVYYPAAAPAPVTSAESNALPAIRRRPPRRRSSPAPALVGAAIAVLAVLGGMWFYFQDNRTVAVGPPNRSRADSGKSDDSGNTDLVSADEVPATSESARPNRDVIPSAVAPPPPVAVASNPPAASGEAGLDRDNSLPDMIHQRPTMPQPAAPQPAMPQPAMPQPAKPEVDKPQSAPQPLEKASAEEAATVGKILQSARAALTNRDVSQAQNLLAEATIEASAPRTMAEVERVETLASHVEMFWEAARQTLPKLQATEAIEIDGDVLAVVEADANHLVARFQGQNRNYTWQKLPAKIAYYLADRWLSPDDPLRNLVLAAFDIVDPKGDRQRAQRLLDAASAANLDAAPFLQELQIARGN